MFLTMSPLCFPKINEVMRFSLNTSKSYSISNYEKKIQPNIITFCQHPSKTKTTLNEELEIPLAEESSKGIGIEKYFDGKNIFITGGTGLLGKVIVEKILRSTPVGKIYVLIKAEDPEAAIDRLEKELSNLDLFGCLREKYGKYYDALIKEKLIPVVGNICEPNLGMDSNSATKILEEVNVIIQSAANTTLNERYDLLLDTNVKGPERLMRFAKTCKNLELLVHISTAYVSGKIEGIIFEKPLIMGMNKRKENSEKSPSWLDVAEEISLALRSSTATTNYDMTKDMKRLGVERSSYYGWHNAYHMTKAMAEIVINEKRGDIPVLIIRPTMIESCYKEPLSGWIQGNRVFDPVTISYGKGQFPAFLGKLDAPMDIIPLDIVVNATLAAIAKHGQMNKPELNVYQMASSVVNPLQYSEFFEYIFEYFSSDPLIELKSFNCIKYYNDITKIKYFDNFNDFSKFTREELSRRMGTKKGNLKALQKQCEAQVRYAERLTKMYEFLGFFNARFHAGNTEKLLSEMSKDEQNCFYIDVRKIDWRKYIQDIHIPGLRRHVLGDW